MFCFKSNPQSSKCCVCLESVKNPVQCKYCIEGIVCPNCIMSMCEAGICDRCPTCRRNNWKKTNKSSSRIVPTAASKRELSTIQLRVNAAWETSRTRSRCEKIGMGCYKCCSFKTYFSLLTILILQWMVGLLVICISSNSPRDITVHELTWIAILVGLPVMHLPMWYCLARCNVGVCGPISYVQWLVWQYHPDNN